MKSNTWRHRIMVLAAICAIQAIHYIVISGKGNSPAYALMYFGSAALADYFLIYIASEQLSGQLSYDIQGLELASMIVNALGFVAYYLYFSPALYNITSWGVFYAIVLRLFYIGRDDASNLGNSLVRGNHTIRPQFYFGKKAR